MPPSSYGSIANKSSNQGPSTPCPDAPTSEIQTEIHAKCQANQDVSSEQADPIHPHLQLAETFRAKYLESWDPSDLEAALQHLKKVVSLVAHGAIERAGYLKTLAELCKLRYEILGGMDDVQTALNLGQEALDLIPAYHPDRPEYLRTLGIAYHDRYRMLGDQEDLKTAVQYLREAANCIPRGHSDGARYLERLGAVYHDRFLRHGDIEDLNMALQNHQTAVNLLQDDHPDRALYLERLGAACHDRFNRLGDLDDLDDALKHHQTAVNLIPDRHPERPRCLERLGAAYHDRSFRSGDTESREIALKYLKEAVDLAPLGHPRQPMYLRSLAIGHHVRFVSIGDSKDLMIALEYYQTAVDLIPTGHPERAAILQTLGAVYYDQYLFQGDIHNLETALRNFQEAADLTPADHPQKAFYLRSLAGGYHERYLRVGDVKDSEIAGQNYQAALDLTPDGHPDQATYLERLGAIHHDQFISQGDLRLLEISLKHFKAAVDLAPVDHPQRGFFIRSLGVTYHNRYERLGDLADLESSIEQQQVAVDLLPPDNLNRPSYLERLGAVRQSRYELLEDVKDWEAALKHFNEALDLLNLNESQHQRAACLRSLGMVYQERFRKSGDLNSLEDALHHYQTACNLIPEGHSEKHRYLQAVGSAHHDYFLQSGNMKDLLTALEYLQTAVENTPETNSERSLHLQRLALGLMSKYRSVARREDLKSIEEYFTRSLTITNSTPAESWKNVLAWATFAAQFQLEHCVSAFKEAFRLLPELLWIGHSIPARHEALRRLGIANATAVATRTCIQLLDLASAVEIVEQGLGTIYQQMLQLKTAVDELPPKMADDFQALSMQLYREGSDPSMSVVNQRNDLIKDIRKIPGFEYFLLAKPYKVLSQASKGGPIVILNTHEDGCDGIIILEPSVYPVHVAFPNMTITALTAQKIVLRELHGHRIRGESAPNRLFGGREGEISRDEQFTTTLQWLWAHIVDPVYRTLESYGIQSGRLWWLPTGAFTGLPLHACSANHDLFIHSYTSTLGSLLDAYSKESPNNTVRVSVIGVTHTGSNRERMLPGVEQELENIRSVIPASQLDSLKDKQATVNAVEHRLQSSGWLHLACHATQDLTEPTKSRLLLYGGNLELGRILKIPLSNAEVVFLAACQTAMGDSELVNESIHIGGGLIAAGFRGAIGTLWSMDDQDGPVISKLFYSYLFRNGRQPRAADAAEALHHAIRDLRGMVPHERWVQFIHMGV
ncbi:CHAT domain-containing protein [Mycena galopus ATCC 62051]|nr:CHAT domain-containing protein [Mycena galopus ATCC 62051]